MYSISNWLTEPKVFYGRDDGCLGASFAICTPHAGVTFSHAGVECHAGMGPAHAGVGSRWRDIFPRWRGMSRWRGPFSPWRGITLTFEASLTGLRLVAFQIFFLNLVGRPANTAGPHEVLARYERRADRDAARPAASHGEAHPQAFLVRRVLCSRRSECSRHDRAERTAR